MINSALASHSLTVRYKEIYDSRGFLAIAESLEFAGLILSKTDKEDIASLLYASHLLGRNEDFIQASGGNTSLKISHYILVKASGKKLCDCLDENIFILLDTKSFDRSNFRFMPSQDICGSELRPSIEAAFHCLVDQKFVIHTHPIDLIRSTLDDSQLQNKLNQSSQYSPVVIDYYKPGAELAAAINDQLQNQKDIYYILKNHGLLYGCEDGAKIVDIHSKIIEKFSPDRLKLPIKYQADSIKPHLNSLEKLGLNAYASLVDQVNALAFNDKMIECLSEKAIFPDAVVFLGNHNLFLNEIPYDWAPYATDLKSAKFILIKDLGVIVVNALSKSARENVELFLKIHFRIFSCLTSFDNINYLTDCQVSELLNWDAEKYRQSMLK